MKNHYSLLTEKGKPWRILQIERVSWKKMGKTWFSLGVEDEGRRVESELESCMGQNNKKGWGKSRPSHLNSLQHIVKQKHGMTKFPF